MFENKRAVVIVDPEPGLESKLRFDSRLTEVVPVCANTISAAQLVLSDTDRIVLGVFVNYDIPEFGWMDVVVAVQQSRPGIPVFLTHDSPPEVSEEDLKHMGITRAVNRTLDFPRMLEIIAPLAVSFDIESALKHAALNQDKAGEVSGAGDGSFSAIRADNFLSGNKSIFDIYVRLGPQKYLKILQAGDSFDAERLESYLRKGVLYFYLKKEVQETYLKYCQHLTLRILRNKQVPIGFKSSQVLNLGQETMNYLKNSGLEKADLAYASNFVDGVNQVFRDLRPRGQETLSKFMDDLVAYDHGVATTAIASLLANALEVESDQAMNILGVAALLHDVGLKELSVDFSDEKESTMSAEQIGVYRTHPEIGARALAKIAGIHPAIPNAVALHHVRRGGLGFPSKVGATKLNLIAEIIGMADDFAKLIVRAKLEPGLDPLSAMQALFPGFSRGSVQAFETTFLLNKLS